MSVRRLQSSADTPEFLYPWEIPKIEDLNDLKGDTPSLAENREVADEEDEAWTHLVEDEIPLKELPTAA